MLNDFRTSKGVDKMINHIARMAQVQQSFHLYCGDGVLPDHASYADYRIETLSTSYAKYLAKTIYAGYRWYQIRDADTLELIEEWKPEEVLH